MKRNFEICSFTLIEILIVLLIFSLVATFIYSVLTSSSSTFYVADTQIYVQQQLRQALDSMIKELRQSNSSRISGVPADGLYCPNVTFSIPLLLNGSDIIWSNDISYTLNSNNQVIRSSGEGNILVLANNISNLSFRRQSASSEVIEIYLTANKTNVFNRSLGLSLNSQAKLRN